MLSKEELELIASIDKDIYFKKMMSIFRISIATILVIAVLWFCWINYMYAKDITKLRKEYGAMFGCYLCGYENLRSCNCFYNYDNSIDVTEEFKLGLGRFNTQRCEER